MVRTDFELLVSWIEIKLFKLFHFHDVAQQQNHISSIGGFFSDHSPNAGSSLWGANEANSNQQSNQGQQQQQQQPQVGFAQIR